MSKISFYTLGCRSNQYETDRMARMAASLGFELVPYPGLADIYVINTCTVTGSADRKSRNIIRHAKRVNPDAKICVTGCYVEAKHFNLTDAVIVIPNKNKLDLAKHLSTSPLSPAFGGIHSPLHFMERGTAVRQGGEEGLSPRIRVNLMIEDGCENFCSYCIVPYVRGKVRSRPVDELIAEAKEMVKGGVKEIVLTGINLGEFSNLPSLISHLSSLDDLLRIRLSSIEPQYVTNELIKTVKNNPKVCKHLHIPMQSGDDGILKAMKRKYSSSDFRDLISGIRKHIRDIAITTDIIVGFPGEDEKAFKNTCKMAEKLKFSRIHIFSYSDRPGTAAAKLPGKVDPKVIAKRHKKLEEMRNKHMIRFNGAFKNKPVDVLIESKDRKTGKYEGLTSNYIRIAIDQPASIGGLVRVKLNPSDIILT